MTPEQFRALKTGDTVRHDHSAVAYVVTANYGDRVTAVRSVDMTNPKEWTVIKPPPSPREP